MLNSTIEQLNSHGDAWAAWLGTSILHAAIVLALAALLWSIVRKRASVQLGYCLFLLVLLKLLVPLEIAVPGRLAQWAPEQLLRSAWTRSEITANVRLGREPSRESQAPAAKTRPRAPTRDADTSSALEEYAVPTPPGMNRRHTDEKTPSGAVLQQVAAGNMPSEAGASVATDGPAAVAGGRTTGPSLLAGMMLFWAVGVCVLAARLVSVQIRFHGRLRKSQPIEIKSLPADFEQLCARVGLKRPVRLIESDVVASPAVWGIRRPMVILPQGMAGSLTAAHLEWIFLHELGHIRRHDLAVNCFQRLVTIVHFVNPAVWIANRMINRLREYACDDVASALGSGPQIESSQAFMGVVRHAAQDRTRLKTQFSAALGAFDSSARASCFQRMTRLLDTDRRLRVRLGLGSLCILVLTAVLTLPHIRAGRAGRRSPKPMFAGIVTAHVDSYRSGTGGSTGLIRSKQMFCGFHYGDAKKTDWTWEIHWELTDHSVGYDVYTFRLMDYSHSGASSPFVTIEDVYYNGQSSVIVFQNGSETLSIEPGSIPLPPGVKRSDGAARKTTSVADDSAATTPLIISGRVVDAQTKEPIENFRMVPGVRNATHSIDWRRGDNIIVANGSYRLEQTEDQLPHLIRIEADGYRVAVSRDVKSDEGNVTVDFGLRQGPNINPQVLAPDGTPVSQAKVALGTYGSYIRVNEGEIFYHSYSEYRLTDNEGRFSFPPQERPFKLMVTHASGCALVEANPDLPPQTIRLQPWGRVEGTLRDGTKPLHGETVNLSHFVVGNERILTSDPPAQVSIHSQSITDSNGRFAFYRVVPGKQFIGHHVVHDITPPHINSYTTHRRDVDVLPGKTVRIDLGGTGRPIVGRLVPSAGLGRRVNWYFAHADLIQIMRPPHDLPIPDEERENDRFSTGWWTWWSITEEGIAWRKRHEKYSAERDDRRKYSTAVDPDGSFRFRDVPAGDYDFKVDLMTAPADDETGMRRRIGTHSHTFTVPQMDGGRSEQPLDLGRLTVEKFLPGWW